MPYKTVKQNCKRSDGKKGKYVLKYKPKSPTKKKKDSQGFVKAGCHTSKKKATAQRAAIEGGPRWMGEVDEANDAFDQYMNEIDNYLREGPKKDSSGHLKQYGAPEGSKRDKQLDQTKKDLAKAKKLRKQGKAGKAKELEQRAYNRRDRMEKKERKDETLLREFIREMLLEKLSKKTKETLKKKAEKRGLTPGSVYAEFRKGLAAYASSGSRKGMTAHQWAHARVNSATPSKPWAVVKKSKAKKKKKSKKK